MNPDFPLASWEVPSRANIPLVAPADHVFEAVWRGRETQIWVRQIQISAHEPRFYFREADSDEAGNWATPRYGVSEYGYMEHIFKPQFHDHWRFLLCRRFYFDGARFGFSGCHELTLGLERGQLFFLGKLGDEQWDSVDFHWPPLELEEFAALRASAVGRWARHQLEDPTSDMGFALSWLHFSEAEKQGHFFGLSQTELQQLKELMKHVLHTQNTLWKTDNIGRSRLRDVPFTWTITNGACLRTDDSDDAPLVDNVLSQADSESGLDDGIMSPRFVFNRGETRFAVISGSHGEKKWNGPERPTL